MVYVYCVAGWEKLDCRLFLYIFSIRTAHIIYLTSLHHFQFSLSPILMVRILCTVRNITDVKKLFGRIYIHIYYIHIIGFCFASSPAVCMHTSTKCSYTVATTEFASCILLLLLSLIFFSFYFIVKCWLVKDYCVHHSNIYMDGVCLNYIFDELFFMYKFCCFGFLLTLFHWIGVDSCISVQCVVLVTFWWILTM